MTRLDAPLGAGAPSYPAPRENVLLLTCMDLRLLDETVRFMAHDNLTNRYDHLVVAGAALGALGALSPECGHWQTAFFDHLRIAHELHNFKDLYILDHRNCGAYRMFLGPEGTFSDTAEDFARETEAHRTYALALKKEIDRWAREKGVELRVLSFLMGLRGDVALLDDKPRRRKGKA